MLNDMTAEDARGITKTSSEVLISNINTLVFESAQKGYRFTTWFYSYAHDPEVDREIVEHFENRGFKVRGTVKGGKQDFGSRFYLELSWY